MFRSKASAAFLEVRIRGADCHGGVHGQMLVVARGSLQSKLCRVGRRGDLRCISGRDGDRAVLIDETAEG